MYLMGVIKKTAKYLLISIVLLVLVAPYWIKLVPTQYFSSLLGKTKLVDKYLCNYSTKVSGESMNQIIPPGTSIDLTRCFDVQNLTEGTVVLYQDNSNLRLGIIRHILPLAPIVYKISDEKAPEVLHDIIKSEIVAITHDIDVSGSQYKAKQDIESFILKSGEYLTELYLAKISKGAGIETSTLEKTTIFSLEKDKFCVVIIPKVNLTNVGIVILNTETQDVILSENGIVFNTSTKPNINCIDFGSGQGLLSLKKGNYQYRFLLNHQILQDIQFKVE